jgi:hypothetical protein
MVVLADGVSSFFSQQKFVKFEHWHFLGLILRFVKREGVTYTRNPLGFAFIHKYPYLYTRISYAYPLGTKFGNMLQDHSLSLSCFSLLEHRTSMKRFVSFQFLYLRQSVWLLGLGISLSQGCYLHKQNKRRHTSMPWAGFEPTIPVFQRAKKIHALDPAATEIGTRPLARLQFCSIYCCVDGLNMYLLERFDA